jgi:hypothetical protein
MRVFRTILGMLLLTTGLPALLAGGGLWAVMQHRDPGGAFSGELQRLTVPGYAVVVPDIDQLLRDDVPFARISDTQLRLSAVTVDGRAFLGLAPSDEVARYLTGVPYSQIDAIDIGTGALPVTTTRTGGRQAPAGPPGQQDFWTATGAGQISLDPGELRDRPYSLVLMNPGGGPVMRIAAIAEIRPGWLNPSTWGLLTLGTLLVMLGVTVLVWPGRRREVVYVVEPSQVPDLMHAIGAPLPLPGGVAYFAGGRSGGAHRPRTLADSRPRPPALPQFAWPPNAPELPSGRAVPLNAATLTNPIPGGTPTDATDDATTGPASAYLAATLVHATQITPAGPASGSPSPGGPTSAGPAASSGSPGSAGSSAAAGSPASVGPASGGSGVAAGSAVAVGSEGSAVAAGSATASAGSGGSLAGSAAGRAAGSFSGFAAGSASTGGSAGAHTPAPGQPLSLLGETPALAGLQPGTVPSRRGERRSNSDLPQFQATAVGAWVAATAPERARQTEARAAARLAEAARRNAGKFAPTQPGNRNTSANARIPIAAPRHDNGEIPAPAQPTQAPGRPETLEAVTDRRLSTAETTVSDSPETTSTPTDPATDPAPTDATFPASTADLTDSTVNPDARTPTESAAEADATELAEPAGKADVARLAAEPTTGVQAEKAVIAEGTDQQHTAATSVANPATKTTADRVLREKKARQDRARRAGSASVGANATPDAVRQDGSKPSSGSAGPAAGPVKPAPARPAPERPVVSRIALRTGPAATDWLATGTTEIRPNPAPRPSPRPSPKPTAANRPASPGRALESDRHEIAEATEAATGPVSEADRSALEQSAEQHPPQKPSAPETETGTEAEAVAGAISAPPEWPLVGKPAGNVTARTATGSETVAGESVTGSESGRQPIVPLPARAASPGSAGRSEGRSMDSAVTGSTAVARSVGSRASLHAAETAVPVPVPDRPGSPDERDASADRIGSRNEQTTTTPEPAATPQEASTTTGRRTPSVAPDQTRALSRSGGDRRSVHTVEADGLGVLPKKPAPVPTQVTTATPQIPVSHTKPETTPGKPAAAERPGIAGKVTAAGKPDFAGEPDVAGESAAAAGPATPEPESQAKPLNARTAETSAATSAVVEAEAPDTLAAGVKPTGEQTPGGSREPMGDAAAKEDLPAGTAERAGPAGADKTPGRARKTAGRKAGDDQPLARAQGRASGKATTARPAPATRRVPAAWIKAAESMAARTGQAGDGTAPVVPEKGATTENSDPAGGTSPQGRAGDEAARPLSYREEAAELLGGGERRRRRTVSGRNRPKTDPGGDENGRSTTGR